MTKDKHLRTTNVPNRQKARRREAEKEFKPLGSTKKIHRALKTIYEEERIRHEERHRDLRRQYRNILKQERYRRIFDNITLPSLLEKKNVNTKHEESYEARMVAELTMQPREPYVGLSVDGKSLVVYIPNFFNEMETKHVHGRLETLVHRAPPLRGPLKRDIPLDGNKIPLYDVSGDYHLCYWKEQGNPYGDALLSKDVCSGSTRFAASTEYLNSINVATTKIAALLHEVDRKYYWKCEKMLKKLPIDMQFLRSSDYDPFVGKAILVNKQVRCHRDLTDYKHGWAAMSVYGEFTGGAFCIPELELKFDYRPGDLIMFRSQSLEHFIEEWSGGYRYATIYFNAQSVFE